MSDMNALLVMGEDGELVMATNAVERICEIETQMKALKKEHEKFRKALLDSMEENGIKQLTNDDYGLKITYVEPTERIGIDTDKLWDKYKDVAFDCQKFSPVKASVRITVR